MEKAKQLYRWSRQEDILWIKHDKVIAKIDAPENTGNSKRLFKISDVVKNIINSYSQ